MIHFLVFLHYSANKNVNIIKCVLLFKKGNRERDQHSVYRAHHLHHEERSGSKIRQRAAGEPGPHLHRTADARHRQIRPTSGNYLF